MLATYYPIIVWFFVLGLLAGGFFNVYLYRVPRGLGLFGPSSCPKCGQKILLYHIIPVLGWMILGGKCRSCKQKIDVRYTLIEFGCGVIFATICTFFLAFADSRETVEAAVGRSLWLGYAVMYIWSLGVFLKANARIPLGIYTIGGLLLATILVQPIFFQVDFLVKAPLETIDDEFYGTMIFTSLYMGAGILGLAGSFSFSAKYLKNELSPLL